MNPRVAQRPAKTEYADFYAGYVDCVPEGEIRSLLREQLDTAVDLFRGIPQAKYGYRYDPGKWSTKEVLGHIIDTERIFSYRMLCFARGDVTPLPGMEQDDYVAGASFDDRDWENLVEEFEHLRQANARLGDSFDDAVLERRGVASECEFTVRAVLYIMVGHVAHHLNVLRERYL